MDIGHWTIHAWPSGRYLTLLKTIRPSNCKPTVPILQGPGLRTYSRLCFQSFWYCAPLGEISQWYNGGNFSQHHRGPSFSILHCSVSVTIDSPGLTAGTSSASARTWRCCCGGGRACADRAERSAPSPSAPPQLSNARLGLPPPWSQKPSRFSFEESTIKNM